MIEFVKVGRRMHLIDTNGKHNTVCGLYYDFTAHMTWKPREDDVCNTCKHHVADDFWGPISSYQEGMI